MSTFQILAIAFFVSLIVNLVGFKKTVWFISIGYTLSIVAVSIMTAILQNAVLQYYNYIQLILLIIWGSRLGYFIIRRESDVNYNASVKDQTDGSEALSLVAKAGIWVSVTVLYVLMFSPAVFALQGIEHLTSFKLVVVVVGLLVMVTGVIMEAVADKQKSDFKKLNPKSYCNTGLYTWVRCPNYLGEILVWLGNVIISLIFLEAWWQSVFVALGLTSIILIMMGSTKRLEKKQSLSYGKDTDFQKYAKSVPILFP